ncbi:GGDEF domain-containing protein [Planctobacterium marinum]|uniref:diguanylate cyclase n=1 Tax=Planctobacterium marinum TaxID=1631968 RepID=A0AA48I3H7_9ALTE|nr:diguanylate cyclase [Planctobacterium marinum]
MSSDDLENSFKILKQTVPLLIKHKISADPTNYAIWYTYASNQSPELNQAVDSAIDSFKTISEARALDMYRTHVADKQEVSAWQLRQSIDAMITEFSQTVKDTRHETNDFRSVMDKSLDGLQKVESEGFSVEKTMSMVRSLVKEGQKIRNSTLTFSAAMANAEKEISELKEKLEVSKKEALVDALTGLNNRRYFDSEFATAVASGQAALILADVDHFKKFNDTHGHQMGDLVLKAVAKKLQQACRDGAQAFRFGGEEFAIILPMSNQDRACHLAETMRRNIEKLQITQKSSGKVIGDITASFGVSAFEPGKSAGKLIETADKQLYEAKRLGRNRVMPIK